MLPLFDIQRYMEKLNGWALEGDSLVKDNTFANFRESVAFVNKVSEIAEKHYHHPTILITYNIVRISLTTHSAKGLTAKDFDVAKEIDGIDNLVDVKKD